MILPQEIRKFCVSEFEEIHTFQSIGGGCINHAGRIETKEGVFFIKWNNARLYPNMFELEAKGLDLLASSGAIHIPKVISVFEGDTHSCLILEYVEGGQRQANYDEKLGLGLAQLHQNTADFYGLDVDNYMGSLEQYNHLKTDWIEFFTDCRLNPQVKMAFDKGLLSTEHIGKFEILFTKLPSILVKEKPALVHGDLWNGNVMINSSGLPCLIDPAVAYAHRETDLAITDLFGGFSQVFYDSYQSVFPTEAGLDERIRVYQLYPLLVHVNLFGGGYISQALQVLTGII